MVSLVVNGKKDDFTGITDVSLWFYEITNSTNEDLGLPLKSSFDCKMQSENKHLPMHLENRRCVNLTGKAFKKLLLFFGYEWRYSDSDTVKSDDDPVEITDLVSFLNIFNSEQLKTGFSSNEGLQTFVKHFQLEFYFKVNMNECITTNTRRFGQMMRCLTNVRIGCFEGQHRLILLGSFLQGLFGVNNEVPLIPQSIAKWKGPMHGLPDIIGRQSSQTLFENCQLFKGHLRCAIAIPYDYDKAKYITDISTAKTILKDFSKQATIQQVSLLGFSIRRCP